MINKGDLVKILAYSKDPHWDTNKDVYQYKPPLVNTIQKIFEISDKYAEGDIHLYGIRLEIGTAVKYIYFTEQELEVVYMS